ncbi:hypothetical protein QVD17_28352 [Tagetes erecta]|uniref:Uncharacterized protein n=1 Tax=Tagetes erecta TaxID=13708 RepID=A0AAD8NKD9_TARER|nr:hypothetical protein QVD17_28352 [Tagetes erecta]
MSSIFSSFDALSAEFFGQSINYFKTKQPVASNSGIHGTEVVDHKKPKPETRDNTAVAPKKGGCSARWAPEFDGINCYESLVFH